jgi:hypothetical protein
MSSAFSSVKSAIQAAWQSSSASDEAITGFESSANDISTQDEQITKIQTAVEEVTALLQETESEAAAKMTNG